MVNGAFQRVCRNRSTFIVSEGWGAGFDRGDYWSSLDRSEDFTHGFELFETLQLCEVAFSIFAVEGLELFAFAFESFVGIRLAFEEWLVDDILQSVQEVATRTTPILVLIGSLRHLDVGAVDELLFA